MTAGERLYLFGGRGEGELADLWSYDLAAGAWSQLATDGGPSARHGHNAVWDVEQGRMVLFGGPAGSAFFNDLWQFDPATNRWAELSTGASVPAARYGAGGAFDPAGGGRMLVTHGFTTTGRFDDTWQYDLAGQSWTEISPGGERPVERCLMRAVWDSTADRLLIFGGQTTATPFLGDLWALGVAGWGEIVADPKPSASNLYATVFDDDRRRLLLFGGKTEQGPANDLWLFNSADESWDQPPVEDAGPSARFSHDAVWLADERSFVVFGGNDGSADLNDLWELSAGS